MGRVEIVKVLGLGPKIKKFRTAAQMSQRDMARALGIPYSTYSNYENGNRTPDMETIHKIWGVLNFPARDLIGSISHRTPEIWRERTPELQTEEERELYLLTRSVLLDYFNKLNGDGWKKAVAYLEDLARIPQYQKEDD